MRMTSTIVAEVLRRVSLFPSHRHIAYLFGLFYGSGRNGGYDPSPFFERMMKGFLQSALHLSD